jgi:hypothetical protein
MQVGRELRHKPHSLILLIHISELTTLRHAMTGRRLVMDANRSEPCGCNADQ